MTSKPIFASSLLVVEAINLRDAASFACNLNLHAVIFETDNQALVEACKGNITKGEIRGIVEC